MQEQSHYFERKGSVNRRFLEKGYELDGKMSDTEDHGEDLNDGCLDYDVYEDCILRVRSVGDR